MSKILTEPIKESDHLFVEIIGCHIGDRMCIKCGFRVNMFDWQNAILKQEDIIPECKNTQKI